MREEDYSVRWTDQKDVQYNNRSIAQKNAGPLMYGDTTRDAAREAAFSSAEMALAEDVSDPGRTLAESVLPGPLLLWFPYVKRRGL